MIAGQRKMSAGGQGHHQYREREYSCSRSASEESSTAQMHDKVLLSVLKPHLCIKREPSRHTMKIPLPREFGQ